MCSIDIEPAGSVYNVLVTLDGPSSEDFNVHIWPDGQEDKPWYRYKDKLQQNYPILSCLKVEEMEKDIIFMFICSKKVESLYMLEKLQKEFINYLK